MFADKESDQDDSQKDNSDQDNSDQNNSDKDNSDRDNSQKDNSDRDNSDQDNSDQDNSEPDYGNNLKFSKFPTRVIDNDTERKKYENELQPDPDYKKLDLDYSKIYEGGREINPNEVTNRQNIKSLPLQKDSQNTILYKDPNENLDDTQKNDDLIDIDENLDSKDKSDLEYPRKDNIVKYDFFKCNLNDDKDSNKKIDKKYPCNASIHERYMFGCKPGDPFATELEQSVGSNYDKIIEDPSDFYKKINRPIIGFVDDFDWSPSNIVKYTNLANYYDIGKIPLDKNKVIPVQYNYVFKNSPSYSFI